jgi:hypothetical protein
MLTDNNILLGDAGYDKYSNNYALYLHLSCIDIILIHMLYKTI